MKYGIKSLYDNKLKNRDGEAGKILGMQFIGEIGMFSELPKGDEMTEEDYERIQQIKRSF